MKLTTEDKNAVEKISQLAKENGIEITGAKIRRTSSRFCLAVEHGDYNGTELFGIGTDRFIWLAYKPNSTTRMRLFSGNFPSDGIIEFDLGNVPGPKSPEIADTWGRFPYGVEYILRRQGITLTKGIDAVVYGNIPGGGMSRSASLTINLILSLLDVNGIEIEDPFRIVDMAQAVENDYIGSPCGQLDQIMILFARSNMGTHYNPRTRSIDYVPLGAGATDFRIVVLDTGTVRPGLEKSTYKVRRAECEELVSILQEKGYDIPWLADIRDESQYEAILTQLAGQYPDLCDRFRYIFGAQKRFYEMLDAWKKGDIETVGRNFRADGIGLRDTYKISGPELEKMCDIARTVEGVLGERMLGGGDKGAAGALVCADAVDALRRAVDDAYPGSYPAYADKYAVHTCKVVQGVEVYEGLLE
ncbi:MAG: galactokinase [Planctomycetota bacterium]|jgi:galactokinase